MITKPIYLDNATTSLKTNKFFADLWSSYLDCDWFSGKEEIIASLLRELSELCNSSRDNIALVPSSTYAINEIWEYIRDIKKGKEFRVYVQREDHISNIASIEYWQKKSIDSSFEISYFSPKEILSIEWGSHDVVLITLMDNLGNNDFSPQDIALLRKNNTDLTIIGDLTQYMPYWSGQESWGNFFDFFYFSAHKCFGPTGLGVIVSTNSNLPKKINSRKNYDLDWRSVYIYTKALQELKIINVAQKKKKEIQLKNFWINNFPKFSELKFSCSNKSLIFLVEFDSEYFHDFLYFLELKNIIFRANDLCSNSSIFLKRKIRFSFSFLNSVDDLKILFNSFREFFQLKLI